MLLTWARDIAYKKRLPRKITAHGVATIDKSIDIKVHIAFPEQCEYKILNI